MDRHFPAQLGRASLKHNRFHGVHVSGQPFPGPIGPGLIEAFGLLRVVELGFRVFPGPIGPGLIEADDP